MQISILNRNIKNIENIEFVEEDNKYYINLSMIIETESSVDRCKTKLELPNIDFKAIVKNGVLEKLETTEVFNINERFKEFEEM